LIFFKRFLIFSKILIYSVIISLIFFPSKTLQTASEVGEATFFYRIGGGLLNVNSITIATICSFLIFDFFIRKLHNHKFTIFQILEFIMLCFMFLMAQSRTAIIGLLVSIVAYIFVAPVVSRSKKFMFIVVSMLISFVALPYFVSYFLRGIEGEALLSMSGRIVWWKYAIEVFDSSSIWVKLIGQGFAFGDKQTANLASDGFMNTLDSTYLACLMSNGILGVIIITSLLLRTLNFYRREIQMQNSNYVYSTVFGVVIILFFKTFTTSSVEVFTIYSFLFILLIGLANSRMLSSKDI